MKIIGKNMLKTSLLGASLLLGSMVSFAARAEQASVTNDTQSAGTTAQAASTTQKKLHLPLDHGPRAEVTPWVNEQRRLRAQQGK